MLYSLLDDLQDCTVLTQKCSVWFLRNIVDRIVKEQLYEIPKNLQPGSIRAILR